MATLQQLQTIEGYVETSSLYILSSSFGYTNVYTSLDESVNAPYPRIELSCLKGSPTGHKFVSDSNDFYDHSYNAQLNVYVVSDRADTRLSEHRTILSNIITALSDNRNFTSASGMPMHYMFKSDFSNQGYQIREEANDGPTYDESAVTFEQIVIIKPQFFP